MRIRSTPLLVVLCFTLCSSVFYSVASADDLEKTQKKEMQSQAKIMRAEAASLEKSGQLVEAREKYAESQSLMETNDATDAIKHLDEEIRKRLKDNLNDARKLYEQRKYKEAAGKLEDAMKLGAHSVVSFDLALCYSQLGDRGKAADFLEKARAGTHDKKQKLSLLQLLAFVTTGENADAANESAKDRINRVNRLSDSIGLEASLEDEGGEEASLPDSDTPPEATAPEPGLKPSAHVGTNSDTNKGPRSSLCNALAELKGSLAKSPAVTFNLANCAETNGRTTEALHLLEKYLELSPDALDADDTRARIADLQSLLALPGQNGVEVRRLYSSAYGALAERNYDRALAAFNKAAELAPDFALTKWKLGLFHEAQGNVDAARENLTRYQALVQDQAAKDEAGLHLTTLDAKRKKYDEEVDAAEDIVADLFNRAMNLTFNGDENRSHLKVKRARVKKKEQNKSRNRTGGFAINFAYAQQQLQKASEHIQIALALFPLGAEANELMGLVFLQANDGHAAIKSFDVVASQDLPVAFYAEMRGHKQDHAVKCELNRDRLRMIFLSTYDKRGTAQPPAKPAGEDGLGDLTLAPGDERQPSFDSLDLKLSDIKKVETDKGLLKLKLVQHDITLAPIYLPSYTPVEGPPARRFANNYTRLFVRYPGLEDSKLGTEGMSGGEKFKMGYNLASSGLDIAMGGFTLIGAISSVQDTISIARTIHAAVSSLNVSVASWERSVNDQQRLLAGKAFKPIPTQPVSLVFVQDTK